MGPKGFKGEPGDPDPSAPEEQKGDAPTVFASPTILTVMENASATFACFAFGEPTPHLFWEREGKGGGINSCFGKLAFEHARLQDSGTYICNVFNRHGRAQASIKLRVQGNSFLSRQCHRLKHLSKFNILKRDNPLLSLLIKLFITCCWPSIAGHDEN